MNLKTKVKQNKQTNKSIKLGFSIRPIDSKYNFYFIYLFFFLKFILFIYLFIYLFIILFIYLFIFILLKFLKGVFKNLKNLQLIYFFQNNLKHLGVLDYEILFFVLFFRKNNFKSNIFESLDKKCKIKMWPMRCK